MSVPYSLRRFAPLLLSLLVLSSSAALAEPAAPVVPGTTGAGAARKSEIHQVLYRIYKMQRNFPAAEKEVTAIAALDPNNALIQQDWGRQLITLGKYKEAIPHFQKATKIDPTNGDYWACLGDCFMQIQSYGSAGEPYKKAVQFQRPPNDYRPRYQQYQQYMQNQQQQIIYKKQLQKQKEDSDD